MKGFILVSLVVLCANFSKAQSTTISFETAEHELSDQAMAVLNEFKKTAVKTPSVQFNIIGHTDPIGGTVYNDNLSKLRSQAVVNYLRSIGVHNQFSIDWKGETALLNSESSDVANTENRRVTIEIAARSDILLTLSQVLETNVESFTLPSSQESKVMLAEGIIVTIRPEDFALENNSDELELIAQAYQSKADFILENLTTTTTGGKLLESRGMVYLDLQQRGRSVNLKKGKYLPIDFPDRKPGDETILFSGREHDGVMTWESQNVSTMRTGYIGTSYMFDENQDTIYLEKSYAITINNEAFEVKEHYENGIIARTDTVSMKNYHAAAKAINESTSLGWINCDKFYKSDTEKVDYFVTIPEDNSAQVLLVFKDISSVISYSDKARNRYTFRDVPVGMDIEVIAMAFRDLKLDFARESGVINQTPMQLKALEEISFNMLESELNDL